MNNAFVMQALRGIEEKKASHQTFIGMLPFAYDFLLNPVSKIRMNYAGSEAERKNPLSYFLLSV